MSESETVIRPFYPTTFTAEGREIRIRVKRFDLDDMARFDRLEAALEPQSDRLLLVRKAPDELERVVPTEVAADERAKLLGVIDDLARRFDPPTLDDARAAAALDAIALLRGLVLRVLPGEYYRLPDDEIRRRREQELSADERRELDRLHQVYREAATELARVSLTDYVSVEPGQLVLVDDQEARVPVTTGAQLLSCFGGRLDVMRQLVAAVRRENQLSEDEKKAWRSRFGSTRSSATRDREVSGPRPDETAALAAPAPSATPEAAMAASATSPSGSTATSS